MSRSNSGGEREANASNSDSIPNKSRWPCSTQPSSYEINVNDPHCSAKYIFPAEYKPHIFFQIAFTMDLSMDLCPCNSHFAFFLAQCFKSMQNCWPCIVLVINPFQF